jgi:hypothetical protein
MVIVCIEEENLEKTVAERVNIRERILLTVM